jgi:hypothetical protein
MSLLLCLGAAVAGVPTPPVAADTPAAPKLTYAFTLHVEVGEPQEQGTVDGRRVRFVPITGGTITGPRLTGTVMAGGGDWQALHGDGLTEVNTRYALKAADGTVIDIVNPGVRVASPEVSARLARGELVDSRLYYFRSTPRFTVGDGPHAWLRRTVFVGYGIRRPRDVEIQVFAVE